MNYNSDKPIEYSEQDLLGRTTFSKQLGEAIYKYDGKEIILRGKFTETLPGYHQTFIMGRQAMVCCANDTSLCGLTVTGVKVEELVKDNWYEVQGNLKTIPLDNGGKTLVLYANRIQNYQKPQDEFVYFS